MQVLEHTPRRLRLKFGHEERSQRMFGIVAVAMFLAATWPIVSEPTHVLTCQPEPETTVVQCEAVERLIGWRSQPQFQLPEVEQASLSTRRVGRRGTQTVYHITLESATGERRTFDGRTGRRGPQERRVMALNQYLAAPQASPWVYRASPNRLGQLVLLLLVLIGTGIGLLLLAFPVTILAELSHTSDQLIVTDRYIDGQKVPRYYRLGDVVAVELVRGTGKYRTGCMTRLVLKSGTKLTLMTTTRCADQERAAALMKQFLGL